MNDLILKDIVKIDRAFKIFAPPLLVSDRKIKKKDKNEYNMDNERNEWMR